MTKIIPKPEIGEYAPYTIMYIGLLPDDGQVLKYLEANLKAVKEIVYSLPEERLAVPHAAGEWTVKEILCHIIDDERIYCYRALRFARNDMTELPGFDQEDYINYSNSNRRELEDIFEEYTAVRQATITFYKSLDDSAYVRMGISNGNVMSVRASAYHIAGHELHHINSIKDNYGL